jgi:hypothetical protein
MAETLAWLRRIRPGAKIVVWAHNSHLGDARATEMSARGERNVGQLVRERFDKDVFLIGFTTIPEKLPPPHNGKLQQKEKSFVPHWKGVMKRSSITRVYPRFCCLCMMMR